MLYLLNLVSIATSLSPKQNQEARCQVSSLQHIQDTKVMEGKENLSLTDIAKMLSDMNKKLDSDIEGVKTELGKSISDQANNIELSMKRTMDEAMIPITKRQDEYEAKSDERFKHLEAKSDERIKNLEETVANLSELVKGNSNDNPKQPSTAAPPAPAYHPLDVPHPVSLPNTVPDQVSNQSNSAIMELIAESRRIVGIGPVQSSDFEYFGKANHEENVRLAAIEALRFELNIKEHEIKDTDIASTFLPQISPKIPRVYIKFYKQEHADLCFRAAKGLKDPTIKVFRYFPRQFQARVKALEEVAFHLRKTSDPKYKTEVVYTNTDVQLLICPRGQSRYYPHTVHYLPPVDMAPARSPPPGRQRHNNKRIRSDDMSPQSSKKSSRQDSPTCPSSNKTLDTSPLACPRPPILNTQDLGSCSSMEVISPLTGKVSFDFRQPVNLRR